MNERWRRNTAEGEREVTVGHFSHRFEAKPSGNATLADLKEQAGKTRVRALEAQSSTTAKAPRQG